MSRTLIAMFASMLAMVVIVWLLGRTDRRQIPDLPASSPAEQATGTQEKTTSNLVIYCAASNRAVIDQIRLDYEQEYGRTVDVQYGPSQTLLSSIEVSRVGDLFLPADDSFMNMAREKKLIAEVVPVAQMRGVLAVRKGNPKSIKSFADLMRSDVRVVQASIEASAIGKLTCEKLKQQALWDKLNDATRAYRSTVTDVANDLLVGAADVGIVYDVVLHPYPALEGVVIPELSEVVSTVSLAVLQSTKHSQQALHFARYVTARDRGMKRYAEHGFEVENGDVWSDVPELSIFAGSMLRPAIDDTIALFEEREGVRVSRVYNGCGILVAQMKAGQHPDAYFACDREFMNSVPDIFPNPVDVSQNELVILVEKGNPLKISSLKDLARPDVRVGIGHEKQCAMGWLTQNTLKASGVQAEVMANVKVQTPSGDMLVNQMRTGSLDAAVAYLSNAAGAAEFLDAIQIEGIPCSVAVQPFAVAANSSHAQTMQRLFQRLLSVESKETFLAEGFRWKLPVKGDSGHGE